MPPFLVTEELAAVWTGRPASTIRRWAAEGRITRHGHGRGNVRYDLAELNPKTEDEDGDVIPGKAPAMPTAHAHAA
ncbi:MAG: DNA-binding protein [Streptomyces sp.]|nr:DNA-binding protein [Streptomyces sp.]